MRATRILFGLMIGAALMTGAAVAQDVTEEPPMQQFGATAMVQDTNGVAIGQVTFSESGDGKLIIIANMTGLTPGFHGLHLHEMGQCDPAGDEPFASAGAHLNPAGVSHPDHAGDLPSLYISADGTGQMMTVTDRVTLADLLDGDGSAIVVHSGADNFANIPERYGTPDEETLTGGDSGTRVACGVIAQDEGMTAG